MGDDAETVVSEPPKEKLWTKKNTILLLGVGYANFTLGTCYSLPAPFFPNEAERKGASPTVYGLVFGVFQLVNLVMSPTWGKLMPYLVPKFVLIAGMFVGGSCSVLFGILEFCPPGLPYIVLSFCVRIVESVGVTAYITTCYGMVPVCFPGHTATVLSTLETLFGFGMIAGPTIGGALYQVDGYYLPFVVMGGCLMIGSAFTALTFPSADESIEQKSGGMFNMIANLSILIDITVFASAASCIGFNDATLEPHLRQFHYSPSVLGAIFIIPGGIYAFSSPFFGRLMDKGVHPHVLCLMGCICGLIAYLFIGPVPFFPFKTYSSVVILSLALQGLGIGCMSISAFMHGMKNVIERGFPDNVSTYAMYTGVCMAFSSLGAFIGPSLGGLFLDHIGYQNGTVFFVGVQATMAALIIVHLTWERARKKRALTSSTRPEEPDISTQGNERTPLLSSDNSIKT